MPGAIGVAQAPQGTLGPVHALQCLTVTVRRAPASGERAATVILPDARPRTRTRSVAFQAPLVIGTVAVRPVPRTPVTVSLTDPVPVAVPRSVTVSVRPRSFAVAAVIVSDVALGAGPVAGTTAGAATV
jgi:hypothetical protein